MRGVPSVAVLHTARTRNAHEMRLRRSCSCVCTGAKSPTRKTMKPGQPGVHNIETAQAHVVMTAMAATDLSSSNESSP